MDKRRFNDIRAKIVNEIIEAKHELNKIVKEYKEIKIWKRF